MNATQAILDFAASEHTLPPGVRADAERLLADTLAVGAAGAASPAARQLRQAMTDWGAGDASRSFAGGRLPAPAAAFHNAFAAHCLEWDAVHEGAVVHALAAVTAALLAASDRRGGSDPDEFLTALAVGVDIACGMGIAATGPMRFFRPGTASLIGAALAAARLEGFPREKYPDVLGLAYSFAGGTMQAHVEASIALPLQIANAARVAINALDLAKSGLNGPHDVLEGPFGYAELFEPLDLSLYIAGLCEVWRIGEVATKPFPSGRASHGALGALAALREEMDLELGAVNAITLHAPPLIQRLVSRPYMPVMTASYARLCLPLLAPMMLRDGVIDPALFESDAVFAPELAALAQHVSVELDGNEDANAMAPQRLEVSLTSGEIIQRIVPATLGSVEAPMSPAQTEIKRALCRRLADPDSRLFDAPLTFASDPR